MKKQILSVLLSLGLFSCNTQVFSIQPSEERAAIAEIKAQIFSLKSEGEENGPVWSKKKKILASLLAFAGVACGTTLAYKKGLLDPKFFLDGFSRLFYKSGQNLDTVSSLHGEIKSLNESDGTSTLQDGKNEQNNEGINLRVSISRGEDTLNNRGKSSTIGKFVKDEFLMGQETEEHSLRGLLGKVEIDKVVKAAIPTLFFGSLCNMAKGIWK